METRDIKLAGILIALFSTVGVGGISILSLIISKTTYLYEHPLRASFWRAGHAHAGVLLIISLVLLQYIKYVNLPKYLKEFVRLSTPVAAILMPFGFFMSTISPSPIAEPNFLIFSTYIGAAILLTGFVLFGVGLIKYRGEKQ